MEHKLKDLIPECGICYTKYDQDKREPYVLPCGHTYCQQCIYALYNKTKPKIICPEGRDVYTFKTQGDIPKNYTLLNQISMHSKIQVPNLNYD